jgi:hypothetical protein
MNQAFELFVGLAKDSHRNIRTLVSDNMKSYARGSRDAFLIAARWVKDHPESAS